jgi:hypothetical protein
MNNDTFATEFHEELQHEQEGAPNIGENSHGGPSAATRNDPLIASALGSPSAAPDEHVKQLRGACVSLCQGQCLVMTHGPL